MSMLALAVGSEFGVVPFKRETAAPVVRRPVALAEVSAERKAKRDERWLFCWLTAELAGKGHATVDAAAIVAATETHRFPSLLTGGKGGKSQLTYNNYRNWTRLLGRKDGKIDWENRDALLDRYATGERESKIDEEWLKVFNAQYLNANGLSVPKAARMASQLLRRQNPFLAVPTDRQVRYYVSRMDKTAVALARQGEEWTKNHMIGYGSREWGDVLNNECWFSDNRVLDFLVGVLDKEQGKLVAKRPYLCAFMDAKSWYFIGWEISVEPPDSGLVRQAFARGIVANGGRAPESVYVDNGGDFNKVGFSTAASFGDFETCVLKELNVRKRNALPYHARSKTIERAFKEVATEHDKWFPSYLGNRPGARPELSRLYSDHPEHLFSLQEVREVFAAYLEMWHGLPNHGKILGGKSPREIWETGKAVARPQMSQEELFMAFLLPLPKTKRVSRAQLKVNKIEYKGEILWPWEGRQVIVKTDRLDDGHVYAFEPCGRLIGEVKAKTSMPALAKTDEEYAAVSENMRTNGRQLKRARALLDSLTGGRHLLAATQQGEGKIVALSERGVISGRSHRIGHYETESALAELAAASAPRALPAPSPAELERKREFDKKLQATLLGEAKESGKVDLGDFL